MRMRKGNAKHTHSDKNIFNRISLKWKLFAFFSLFVFFTLLIVWILQVRLLNTFYERIRHEDVERTADAVEANLENDSLNDIIYQYASDYSLCVRIFEINMSDSTDENSGSTCQFSVKETISVEGSGECFIHFMSNDDIVRMYKKALKNNGVYVEKLKFNPFGKSEHSSDYHTQRENTGLAVNTSSCSGLLNSYTDAEIKALNESLDVAEPEDYYRSSNKEANKHYANTGDPVSSEIYVRISDNSALGRYVIILNANLLPVTSIVNTLEIQFVWIVIFMLLLALLLALIIAKIIAKPISEMNCSAKKLSEGNYNVTFTEAGCRETVELAKTLNTAANELSENTRLQKELIANISHDLRTPLTMICGYSEVMRDIPEENTPENMQVIIDEAKRMSGLVSDLLDISKIQSGARRPVLENFDITETVGEVLERYKKLKEHDGYKITFDFDNNYYVCADKTMILQVIYNLINNAINYCGDDKVVKISQTLSGDRVRITVADNGEGIAPDKLRYIWDRYYKVDSVHKRATVGTGLGLSIVKEILEKHDAKYGVYSTQGVGSAFWFELKTV